MNILYDGFIYMIQNSGGINRYFAEIIDKLPSSCKPVLTTRDIRKINFPTSPNIEIIQYRPLKLWPRRVFHRLDIYYDRMRTRSRKFDIVHPTYYNLLTNEPISSYKCPVVLTVYDMLDEKIIHPTGLTALNDFLLRKRSAIESATKIICISESTKRDLMEIYAVPEDKITVTYLAAGLGADISHGGEVVPAAPYFLFVGSRAKYKNFILLLSAFCQIVKMDSNVRLCVVGAPFSADEQSIISEKGLASRIDHYGFATDEHLAKLYRCSIAFVYPSLYEGFGIPPLEAMACGTIVVASNTSSLPEVVGDAGLLFDPTDVAELTDRMRAIVQGTIDRADLIERGRLRAQLFHWSRTAEQTVRVYESV